jgi:putative membrane protein
MRLCLEPSIVQEEMMRALLRTVVLSSALAVGASAFAADTAKPAEKPTAQDSAKSGVVIPNDEQAFLERLHFANQQEIKLGTLAKEKSTNPQVKQFAENMVTAHTKADAEVTAYAKTKNLALSEPKPMNDAEQKAMDADRAQMDELRSLKGNAFDSAYISAMVGDHDTVLGKLYAGEKQFKGTGTEQLVRKLIPEVSHHRAEAYKLLGQMTPKPAT